MWTLALVLAGICSAGEVREASLVGDRAGWRLEFSCSQEPLSRVWSPTAGVLRVEFQDMQANQLRHDFDDNPWFSSASVVAGRNASYEFRLRPGVNVSSRLMRTWDGRHLRVVLSRQSAGHPFVEALRFKASAKNLPEVASLSKAAPVSLRSMRLVSSQDEDVLELKFAGAPETARLHLGGEGRSLDVNVGALKGGAKGGTVNAGAVRAISLSKTSVHLQLQEMVRSATLNRMGDVVVVRMRHEGAPVAGVLVWNSGSKTEKYGSGNGGVPSDELQPLGKAVVAMPHRTFSPASSAPAIAGSASQDAAQLEAERRKSQEFTLKQKMEDEAKQSQEETQSRIVYHTFGVRDPFLPLDPGDAAGGLNIDQMRVVGIIFSRAKRMAVLENVTQPGLSVALKEGDPIQNGRVLRIEKERVIFALQEFGKTRQFALRLQASKGDRT